MLASGGRYLGSLTARAVTRSVAKLSTLAVISRSSGRRRHARGRVVPVEDQAAGADEDDHVTVGLRRVGAGELGALHRLGRVGPDGGLAGGVRRGVDVERGLHQLTRRIELRQDREHHQEAAESGQHHPQLAHRYLPVMPARRPNSSSAAGPVGASVDTRLPADDRPATTVRPWPRTATATPRPDARRHPWLRDRPGAPVAHLDPGADAATGRPSPGCSPAATTPSPSSSWSAASWPPAACSASWTAPGEDPARRDLAAALDPASRPTSTRW